MAIDPESNNLLEWLDKKIISFKDFFYQVWIDYKYKLLKEWEDKIKLII